MKDEIGKVFLVGIDGADEGTMLIPPAIFITNPEATKEITDIIRKKAIETNQTFYISTVAVSTGILMSWSRDYIKAIPELSDEEDLEGDGLVYILKKVG